MPHLRHRGQLITEKAWQFITLNLTQLHSELLLNSKQLGVTKLQMAGCVLLRWMIGLNQLYCSTACKFASLNRQDGNRPA